MVIAKETRFEKLLDGQLSLDPVRGVFRETRQVAFSLLGSLAEGRIFELAKELNVVRGEEFATADGAVFVPHELPSAIGSGFNLPGTWAERHKHVDSELRQQKGTITAFDIKQIGYQITVTPDYNHNQWKPAASIPSTPKDERNVTWLLCTFARQPDRLAIIPWGTQRIAAHYSDLLLWYSYIPPAAQPYTFHISKLMYAIRNITRSLNKNVDYVVPGSGITIPNWRPGHSSFEVLQASASSNLQTKLLDAKRDGFDYLQWLLKPLNFMVDWHPLQPLVADARVITPDAVTVDVECKLAQVDEVTVPGKVVFTRLDWCAEEDEVEAEDDIADADTRKARRNPFHPSRSWHFLFTINKMQRFAYFIPRIHVHLENWHIRSYPLTVKASSISRFRIPLNDPDASGKIIGSLIKSYANQEMPTHHQLYESLQAPMQELAKKVNPSKSYDHSQLGIMGSFYYYGPWWLFEKINDQLAQLGHGLLIPCHKWHPDANFILIWWVWTPEQKQRWFADHEMPTGICMDNLPNDSPYMPIRLLNATHARSFRGEDRVFMTSERRTALNQFAKPALVLFDQCGYDSRNTPHGYHLVPSELIKKRQDKGRNSVVLLHKDVQIEQLLVPDSMLGQRMLDFFQRMDKRVPWMKQLWRRERSDFVLDDKKVYYDTITGLLQAQVTNAWYIKQMEEIEEREERDDE